MEVLGKGAVLLMKVEEEGMGVRLRAGGIQLTAPPKVCGTAQAGSPG